MRSGRSERLHVPKSQSQNEHHDILGATEITRRLRKECESEKEAANHSHFTELRQVDLEFEIRRRHDVKSKKDRRSLDEQTGVEPQHIP